MRLNADRSRTFLFLFAAAVFFAACGYAGEAVDPAVIQGDWRNVAVEGEPDYIRVQGDSVRIGEFEDFFIVPAIRDGRVVARIAGTDDILFVATVVGDGELHCYFPMLRKRGNFRAVVGATLDELLGPWIMSMTNRRGGNRQTNIVIGKDSIQEVGGRAEKTRIEIRDDEFWLHPVDHDDKPIIITRLGDGRLQGKMQEDDDMVAVFTRPKPGEKAAMLAEARYRGNEYAAVAALKAYLTAQVTYQVGKQGKVKGNSRTGDRGYADNFRNLYYGNPANDAGKNLHLITKAMADAFAGPTRGAETVASPTAPEAAAKAHNGYLFLEPADINYAKTCALAAYPEKLGVTGDKIFWIDERGTVYSMSPNKRGSRRPETGKTPAPLLVREYPENAPELWEAE